MKPKYFIFYCLAILWSVLTSETHAQWQTSGSNIYYNSGNVGIGTTNVHNYQSWNRVLDIFGTSNAKLLVRSTNIKTGIFSHETWSGTVGRMGTESIHDLRLMAGYGTDVMTLKTNGNVGIGTTNPDAKLEVYAGVGGGWSTFIRNVSGSGNGLLVQAASGGNDASIMQLRDNNLNIRMQVLSNGNVGIGTNTPTAKLTVAGDIRAREVKVEANAGADFVFAPNYRLRPLAEVEQFITANRHLPDIAPADSMVQNGVNMGDMQIRLLQKIEELTLYVIELKKENEMQGNRIDAQQVEIKLLKERINQ